jgi:thiol-disulfide isomerase/thioredoxin
MNFIRKSLAAVIFSGAVVCGVANGGVSEKVAGLEAEVAQSVVNEEVDNSEIKPDVLQMVEELKYKPEDEQNNPTVYNEMFHELGRPLDNGHERLVLKFSAEWCFPCMKLSPEVEKLAKEYDNVKFVGVDVDSNPGLVSQYRLWESKKGVPSFAVLDPKTGKPLFKDTVHFKEMQEYLPEKPKKE